VYDKAVLQVAVEQKVCKVARESETPTIDEIFLQYREVNKNFVPLTTAQAFFDLPGRYAYKDGVPISVIVHAIPYNRMKYVYETAARICNLPTAVDDGHVKLCNERFATCVREIAMREFESVTHAVVKYQKGLKAVWREVEELRRLSIVRARRGRVDDAQRVPVRPPTLERDHDKGKQTTSLSTQASQVHRSARRRRRVSEDDDDDDEDDDVDDKGSTEDLLSAGSSGAADENEDSADESDNARVEALVDRSVSDNHTSATTKRKRLLESDDDDDVSEADVVQSRDKRVRI